MVPLVTLAVSCNNCFVPHHHTLVTWKNGCIKGGKACRVIGRGSVLVGKPCSFITSSLPSQTPVLPAECIYGLRMIICIFNLVKTRHSFSAATTTMKVQFNLCFSEHELIIKSGVLPRHLFRQHGMLKIQIQDQNFFNLKNYNYALKVAQNYVLNSLWPKIDLRQDMLSSLRIEISSEYLPQICPNFTRVSQNYPR